MQTWSEWSDLSSQLSLIRNYNERYWEGYLDEEQLAAAQAICSFRFDGLELSLLHVQFDTFEETLRNWWLVLRGELGDVYDAGLLGEQPLYSIDGLGQQYAPGIHLVGLQFTGGWPYGLSRSVHEARMRARQAPQSLAGIETLSAFGLHPARLGHSDGFQEPMVAMAGLGARTAGYEVCPYLGWLNPPMIAVLGLTSVRRQNAALVYPRIVDPRNYLRRS